MAVCRHRPPDPRNELERITRYAVACVRNRARRGVLPRAADPGDLVHEILLELGETFGLSLIDQALSSGFAGEPGRQALERVFFRTIHRTLDRLLQAPPKRARGGRSQPMPEILEQTIRQVIERRLIQEGSCGASRDVLVKAVGRALRTAFGRRSSLDFVGHALGSRFAGEPGRRALRKVFHLTIRRALDRAVRKSLDRAVPPVPERTKPRRSAETSYEVADDGQIAVRVSKRARDLSDLAFDLAEILKGYKELDSRIWHMHWKDKMTTREIAEELGMGNTTVWETIQRILQDLRRRLVSYDLQNEGPGGNGRNPGAGGLPASSGPSVPGGLGSQTGGLPGSAADQEPATYKEAHP